MSETFKPKTITSLKHRARRLRLDLRINHADALDLAAQQAGYRDFWHARDVLEPVLGPIATSRPGMGRVAQTPSGAPDPVILDKGEAGEGAQPALTAQQGVPLSALLDEVMAVPEAGTSQREARVQRVLDRAHPSLFRHMGLESRSRFEELFLAQFISDLDVFADARVRARKDELWAQVRPYPTGIEDLQAMTATEKAASAAMQAARDFERLSQNAFGLHATQAGLADGVFARSKVEHATQAAAEAATRHVLGAASHIAPTSAFDLVVEESLRAQRAALRYEAQVKASDRLAAEMRRADDVYRAARRAGYL